MTGIEATRRLGGTWDGREGFAGCPVHPDKWLRIPNVPGELQIKTHADCDSAALEEALRIRGITDEDSGERKAKREILKDRTRRPLRIAANVENIPAEIRAAPRWVLWRYEWGEGRKEWAKQPFQTNGRLAKSNDPKTWATFDEIRAVHGDGAYDGIGFMLGDGFAGVDLDECLDENRKLASWAEKIVKLLDSYTEVSPSGMGVKIFLRGALPPGGRRTGKIEMYDFARFFTVTGHHHGQLTVPGERTQALAHLHAELFPSGKENEGRAAKGNGRTFADERVLELARQATNAEKFIRLCEGDTSGYSSASEADLAFLGVLAFYTKDVAQLDRLFRRSGLAREKWDEKRGTETYGERTIRKVLERGGEMYSGARATGPDTHAAAVHSGAAEEEWREPRALPTELPDVPTLLAALLPAALRPWLEDAAERLQVPLEMVSVPAIVSAASLIGRTAGIAPKRRDDWTVVPNLWGAIIGRSGVLKSPAVLEGTRWLRRLAAEASEEYRESASNAEIERQLGELKIAGLKKRGAKKGADAETLRDELRALAEAKAKAIAIERRYETQDATVEKLGELLNENPRGLLLRRDELTGWLRTLDKPGREGDREFFLETWNGLGSYTVDRIGRGTQHVTSLTLSVIGGIQPGKLRAYVAEALLDGDGADGLLQRFQATVWPDVQAEWVNVDRWPDSEARERAWRVFQDLDQLDPVKVGASPGASVSSVSAQGGGSYRSTEVPAIRFADDAQELFDEWRKELEKRLRSPDLAATPAYESHLAKYRSFMPALALVLHVVDVVAGDAKAGPVSLDASRRAAALVDFFDAHARRVYIVELEPGDAEARALADRIKAGVVADKTPVRELYRPQWSMLRTSEAVERAIARLIPLEYVRVEERDTGGRPERLLRIHPRFRKEAAR